jgi:hypothetical protein
MQYLTHTALHKGNSSRLSESICISKITNGNVNNTQGFFNVSGSHHPMSGFSKKLNEIIFNGNGEINRKEQFL